MRKLTISTSDKGGRPTRYRNSLGDEIMAALDSGKTAEEILIALDTSFAELHRWKGKCATLAKALRRMVGEPSEEDRLGDCDSYDEQLEHGEIEAVRTLRMILRTGTSDSARVQAARELLDRKRGKPVQTNVVEQNTTYTIVAAIPAPPNSAARSARAIESNHEVIENE